jgi:hypothetical protein
MLRVEPAGASDTLLVDGNGGADVRTRESSECGDGNDGPEADEPTT